MKKTLPVMKLKTKRIDNRVQPLVIPTNAIIERKRERFHWSPLDMYTINILIKPMSIANMKGFVSMKTDVTNVQT